MADLTRHIGRYANSGSRVVVVFRKLEDDPTNCLLIETDSLPDMVQDNVMKIVNSPAGQKEIDLYQAMNKSTLSDGSNALTALHQRGLLKKVDIKLVEMMPMTNRPVPLADINAAIDGTAAPVEKQIQDPVEATADVSKMDTGDVDKNAQIAAGLITQAELMEADAKAKRDQAYKLDPSLEPEAYDVDQHRTKAKTKKTTKKKVSDGRKKTAEEKAATLEARNERRREAYAKKQADQVDAKLDKQVAEKIARDAEFAAND